MGKLKDISAVKHAWCLDNSGYEKSGNEVERITAPVPSQRQLQYLEMEYYNFIHFGVNTVYNQEWGTGKEDISLFNPTSLDTDQWCKILKNTGSKGVIITAKHHDGFCLWDTKYTDHCVMNTPYGKDIVASLRKSCDKYGLKMGIYVSPWDRHEKRYGTEEYNDYFVSQLTELATNYGEIFTFWFDGACGEGENGKKQVYDWDRYYSVIREKQPNAVIAICGPDVRWIGNEGGKVRKSEWSVIPLQSDDNAKIMENSQQNADEGKKMAKLVDTDEDLGSREILEKYETLVYKPAEADVSINYGWFYTNKKFSHAHKQRSAKHLAKIYFNAVGGNASMLLNVPPDSRGLIASREEKTLEKFAQLIKKPFENPVLLKEVSALGKESERKADFSKESVKFSDFEYALKLSLNEKTTVKTIVLSEDIRFSQRIEKYEIYAKTSGGYKLIKSNTIIGSKRIERIKGVLTDEVVIVVTQSRGNPIIKNAQLYC